MSGSRDEDAQAETLVAPSEPRGHVDPERASPTGLSEETVIGRYRLLRRLGAGAMGVVWAAHDPQLDRTVAIKVVHPALVSSPEASSRLMREARALAKVSHRAVVIVHDAGDVGHLFIAMELVEGTNLGAMFRERTVASLADWQHWLSLMIEAGRGLVAAHRAGVLHRDFKPDNVLVDREGRVCVGDFGLATLGDRGEMAERLALSMRNGERGIELTSTGALVGTPIYMSPQALRSEEIDARADQFAFCVATWEALYGTRPFVTDKQGFEAIADLASTIETGALPSPPGGSTVPREVRAHLARGLAADPTTRWPDMASLIDALQSAMQRVSQPIAEATRTTGKRRLWVAGALAAIGASALVVAVVVRDRSPPVAAPASPPVVVSTGPVAKKLFSLSLRTGLAMSPDGRYLALSSDRLQVRDTETGAQWSTLLSRENEVSHAEIDENTVEFGARNIGDIRRWKFRTSEPPETLRTIPGAWHWFGSLAEGDLFVVETAKLALYAPDGTKLHTWSFDETVTDIVISPDRRRFAFVEPGRFSGRIAWADATTERLHYSEPLVSPTSVTFLDSETFLYAQGTIEQPRIFRAAITPTGIGPPTQIYGLDNGWFGPMAAHGKRLYVTQMQPRPRASVLLREGDKIRKRDLDNASVSLGWVTGGKPDEFLAWNLVSRVIERRTPDGPLAFTPASLDGEPANATTAGPILIAALRRSAGREVVAVSVADGNVLWRHQDGRTFSVRCAGDLAPPCFAVRIQDAAQPDDGVDQLVTLDPQTGELGTKPIYTGAIEDIAVAPDGKKIVFVGRLSTITEIDLAGNKLSERSIATGNLRSVAYDPKGGILLGGTHQRNNYVVLRVAADDTRTIVAESDDDILSLVRPSPDGSRVLYLARLFAPELWQVDFPKPLAETQ